VVDEFAGIKDDHLAPVSCMIHDRYVNESGCINWTPEQVDKIIELSKYEALGSEEDGTLIFGQIDNTEKRKAKRKSNEDIRKKRKKATEGALLPPGQLIRLLTFVLNNERLETFFSLA
jgi:hypothetical protein